MQAEKSRGFDLREHWFLIAALFTCGVMFLFNCARGHWWNAAGLLGIVAFIAISNWLILRWYAGSTIDDMTTGVDTVELNELTRSMIGHWGKDGEALLIVSQSGRHVKLSHPKNETWLTVIGDAKIIEDAIHFTEKSYLLDGTRHPFNGVATNSLVKMIDAHTLELGLTSKELPEYAAEKLVRV